MVCYFVQSWINNNPFVEPEAYRHRLYSNVFQIMNPSYSQSTVFQAKKIENNNSAKHC